MFCRYWSFFCGSTWMVCRTRCSIFDQMINLQQITAKANRKIEFHSDRIRIFGWIRYVLICVVATPRNDQRFFVLWPLIESVENIRSNKLADNERNNPHTGVERRWRCQTTAHKIENRIIMPFGVVRLWPMANGEKKKFARTTQESSEKFASHRNNWQWHTLALATRGDRISTHKWIIEFPFALLERTDLMWYQNATLLKWQETLELEWWRPKCMARIR